MLKQLIKKSWLITQVYRFGFRVAATLFWNLDFILNKFRHNPVCYANCFVFTTFYGRLKKNNWGDDLNYYLFKELSNNKLKFSPFDKLFFAPYIEKYSLIGSIIGDFDLNNTIIYGSGSITFEPKLIGKPKKVLSVRGPLTRQVLLKNGIECPEIYGDPALLVPLVYKPKNICKNKIGIIPHYRTMNSEWVKSLRNDNDDIIIIDMSSYNKWTDIIDSILQCKIIISESLHGLIISEAYSIPSVWIEITPHTCSWEWDFKYKDFYSSIGKSKEICYKIYDGIELDELIKISDRWIPGNIDYEAMLRVFPFTLNKDIKI